jgi:hypothetical protein
MVAVSSWQAAPVLKLLILKPLGMRPEGPLFHSNLLRERRCLFLDRFAPGGVVVNHNLLRQLGRGR